MVKSASYRNIVRGGDVMELNYENARELYIGRKLSITKCAKECGVSYAKMNKFLEESGIKIGVRKNDVPDISTIISQDNRKKDVKLKSISAKKGVKSKAKSSNTSTKKSTKSGDKVNKEGQPKGRKPKEITMQDKIMYCNKKYGFGCWRFMDKDEIREALIIDFM